MDISVARAGPAFVFLSFLFTDFLLRLVLFATTRLIFVVLLLYNITELPPILLC